MNLGDGPTQTWVMGRHVPKKGDEKLQDLGIKDDYTVYVYVKFPNVKTQTMDETMRQYCGGMVCSGFFRLQDTLISVTTSKY